MSIVCLNLIFKYQKMEEKLGNVKVVCRFRPLNEREKALGNAIVHDLLDEKTVAIKDLKQKVDKKETDTLKFSFDKVFDSNSKQEEVYQYAAAPVIDSVIEGFNGTIFAYGQTASGKTHTMQGEITPELTQQAGIIPRMVRQVFDSIGKCTENVEFRIKISMVELYMEKLRDLIDTSKNDMKIRSDKKKGIFIENLTENYISSPEEVYALMQVARSTRAIAATNMNDRSSRSHLLFILTISQNNLDDLSAKTGKLYLVDLAGSEKVGKTGAEGKVLDEAKKINISLTALGKVINALTDGKSTHVPYRDSKLTRVLQESLGGNSKTSLIVTCSPHPNNAAETISTLRFGISAKKIKNKPKINKEMTVAELQNLLQKTQRDLADREKYIEQLKTYITTDLKQKVAPAFTNADKVAIPEQEDIDLVGQLEKQLQIERNLNLVQEEQFSHLKSKYERILLEKQGLQNELGAEKKKMKIEASTRYEQLSKDTIGIEDLIAELESISPKNIIDVLKEKNGARLSSANTSAQYEELLEKYQVEKEQRLESEEKIKRQEKNMNKKLSQLENNICQLTHSYYDLLIVQQRHKVDNIFLKKKLEEKDISIFSLKEKIRDLEDQNRDLEQQQWVNEEDSKVDERKPLSKYCVSKEQNTKLDEFMMGPKANNLQKVVKVVPSGYNNKRANVINS